MKKSSILLVALLATLFTTAQAQQVTTIYFLENAPMRHTINPAFQPVSQGYVNFTPLGWTSISVGNNSITPADYLIYDPQTGKTITPFHPNADREAFLKTLRTMTLVDGEVTLGILNFGFRHKEKGYVMIGINGRSNFGATIPKSIFNFALGGGMTNLEPGQINSFDLSGFGPGAMAYTEISGGYSYQLNEQWTIGGKLKFLLGQMHMGARTKTLGLDASTDGWRIKGDVALELSGPFDYNQLPPMEGRRIGDVIKDFTGDGKAPGPYDITKVANYKDIKAMLTPSGYGAAIDFGFTYKPIENLQISAALNDLGFIYWTNSHKYTAHLDTTFTGVGTIDYNDPAFRDENNNFSTQLVLDSALKNIRGLVDGLLMHQAGSGYAKMVNARLNIGLDANFWDNRIGIGIVSATRLYNARLYEEITLGFSFRPVHWFNIAASYSLMNNGKYSNIGAGLSFMPYDGINLTLAMDYIPTSYAGIEVNGQKKYLVPTKTKGVNLAMGFSICWGTNRRDRDKDGVWDKIDMCPNTPRGVEVDSVGCPIDSDHDGVPDYLDHCPGTPVAAIGFVDSVGCVLDTDGDGVPDYLDQCPNTPEAAWGMVDSVGCPIDTDGDGVPDYLDKCPDTPEAAYGMIDSVGCPIDSDGDGVPDYIDQCPNTPEAAWGLVDSVGCPIDLDGDGVPDYMDECPNTVPAAIGHVDAKGCDLDSDEDGVPDYLDECPLVPGIKANKGCPEIKREVRQLLQKAMQGIEFETGKANIKPKSYNILDKIAQTFIENENYVIEVQGHTDNTGKADVNKRISDKRAHAVMDYLVKKGVPAERMTAVGYGQEQPIADNKTKAGRSKNRRVEFKITFEVVHIETILDHADPAPEAPAAQEASAAQETPAAPEVKE